MNCISPSEVPCILGHLGFIIRDDHRWYRSGLALKNEIASSQARVGGRPSANPDHLLKLVLSIVGWLPNNARKVLWIDHFEELQAGVTSLFLAARSGLGERRSLSEAPGHVFGSFNVEQLESFELSTEKNKEIEILIGLMVLALIGSWDAWIVTDTMADRVEFWEGNVFFYSSHVESINRAKRILELLNFAELK